MTILASELKFYKSKVVSSDSSNGGRISANRVVSGVVNNLWPHALSELRALGTTAFYGGPLYRKVGLKVENDADEPLLASKFFNEFPTAGGDFIYMFAATQRDTQADITGSERKYGAARITTAIAGGGSEIIADVDFAELTGIFQNADKIRIMEGSVFDDLTISGVPSVSGTELTIPVAEVIGNAYTVAGASVTSILPQGTIEAFVDNWDDTDTVSGTYNETNFPVAIDSIGTVEETWTRTMTSDTDFVVSGDTLGVIGTGSISSDFSPINPDFNKPYFTHFAAGNGGTWAANESITWQTHPAIFPFWLAQVIPPNCGSLLNNKNTTTVTGESA